MNDAKTMLIEKKDLASTIHTLFTMKTSRFIKCHNWNEIFLDYVNGKMLKAK